MCTYLQLQGKEVTIWIIDFKVKILKITKLQLLEFCTKPFLNNCRLTPLDMGGGLLETPLKSRQNA